MPGPIAASLILVALAGCASLDAPYQALPAADQLRQDDASGECLRRLQALDAAVEAAALRDAQAHRVVGFPYLRADRFAVRPAAAEPMAAGEARARVQRMAALDAEARAFEMKNLELPATERAQIERCQQELAAEALPTAPRAVAAAVVPDSYSDALRALGLYPLAQIPFSAGVADWQNGVLQGFRTPWPQVPAAGQRERYVIEAAGGAGEVGLLAGAAGVAAVAGAAGAPSAMEPPASSAERWWALLRLHAPVIVVDTVSDDDRIGALAWLRVPGGEQITVDVRDPVVYARIAWTEFAGAMRLQLVYTFWFPARTARSAFDLEAGPLDGLIWRVTLDERERPLVYDSIHPCGCFHMFFPTESLRLRSETGAQGPFDEPLLAPQVPSAPLPGQRLAIYLSAGTHQIERLLVEVRDETKHEAKHEAKGAQPGRTYRLLDENRLRALPRAAGEGSTRSAYGPDAMIAGTERAERWFYWPMGIASAGQMRQWGHHATAFVGRRHFDDPLLIERYFTLAPRQ